MKKHFINTTILAFTLVLFIFSSCKKDEDAKSAKDYLTAGNWKTVAATINPGIDLGNGNIVTDMYALMDPCDTDDFVKFNTDGTITDDEGATKCEPNDPQTTTDGTWTLSDDGKTFTVNYPGDEPVVNTIETLNGSTFKFNFSATLTNPGGTGETAYVYTMTMAIN